MKGTIVNVVAVLIGSFVGIFFSRFITDRIKSIMIQGLGLAVILIGMTMAMETRNILIVTASIVLGGIVGEIIDIEGRLDVLGEWLKGRFGSDSGTFVTGFVTASLVYCVGAMAVVGSLEEGINGNPQILYAKSLLDGVASVAFASTLGIGVVFSVIPVFVYQGSLTFLGIYLERFLTEGVVAELTATGGLLILGIGINLIFSTLNGGISGDEIVPIDGSIGKDDKDNSRVIIGEEPPKIRVGNLLPALLFAVIITYIVEYFSQLMI